MAFAEEEAERIEVPAENEHVVGGKPEGESFGRGFGVVLEIGVGFEEIVDDLGSGREKNGGGQVLMALS